jgi:hypothetical protein
MEAMRAAMLINSQLDAVVPMEWLQFSAKQPQRLYSQDIGGSQEIASSVAEALTQASTML